MPYEPLQSRRMLLGAAKRLLALQGGSSEPRPPTIDDIPRLTFSALEKIRMSRTRDLILANLDDMYREAFERAKAADDAGQMTTLDFSYRREQLYLEILLDIRDATERRSGN